MVTKRFQKKLTFLYNSLLLNLRGWKTADKDAYWFSFEVSLFSPISNENLPEMTSGASKCIFFNSIFDLYTRGHIHYRSGLQDCMQVQCTLLAREN